MEEPFLIRAARPADTAELLRLIRGLAIYEKLEDQAVGTEPQLREQLFGPRPAAEALIVERGGGRFEWRVLDWNEPSIRFYEALGATIMREWLLARVTGPELERLAAR